MKKTVKRIIGIALAVCIVLAGGLWAGDAKMKATDGEEVPEVVKAAEAPATEEVVVEQTPEYTVSEVVPAAPTEEAAPADEAAPAEEAAPTEETAPAEEATPAEEAAEAAEEVFNVEEAYKHYITLNETEKKEYLDSLSAENREALLKYIEKKEAEAAGEEETEEATEVEEVAEEVTEEVAEENPKEAVLAEEAAEEAAEEENTHVEEPEEVEEEVEKTVDVWYEYTGRRVVGLKVKVCSKISGYSDNVSYQWFYSTDGENWIAIAGANKPTYDFVLDRVNCNYYYKLEVVEND